jgi:hypothetical protein
VKLATLPGFVEDGPSLVPGGIAQLVLDFDPAQPLARVYIRRNGRARLVALPLDATAAASLGGFKGGSLLAQWPELQVVISGKARTLVCRSEDGGATWQVF